MPIQSRRPARRGFTLIELLMVVAIIALLISLVLPAMGGVREVANSLVCKNSMRQFAITLDIYSDDNDDEYPPTWGAPRWTEALLAYADVSTRVEEVTEDINENGVIDDNETFRRVVYNFTDADGNATGAVPRILEAMLCPEDPGSETNGKRDEPEIEPNRKRSYIINGFNDFLARRTLTGQGVDDWQSQLLGLGRGGLGQLIEGRSMRRYAIPNFSQTAVFGEKLSSSRHHWLDLIEAGRGAIGNDFTQMDPRRHFNNQSNFAMGDGSVQSIDHPDSFTPYNVWGVTDWGRQDVLIVLEDEVDSRDEVEE